MPMVLQRVVIYTKKLEQMITFYARFFDYEPVCDEADRITELQSKTGGLTLLLHPAAKGQKEGQTLVKLVFDVEDVQRTRARLIDAGLAVGPVHRGDDYTFAKLKDPSGNAVSISSRAFKGRHR